RRAREAKLKSDPAMTVQTACSTSLVAIATACQNLEAYQCDMALAGGVTIVVPQRRGYAYREGGMLSPDGRCRPFDAAAAGTVFSNGAAVLLLKRLEDALADKDTIHAVIRGYATNNDGGEKMSYTAPSADGQAEVISLALGMGDIPARSIGYVEAHGTATPLGDPIEVAGLTQAFRAQTDDVGFCALGSVKANLGHLDVASGAIGLIKTALCLRDGVLPPLPHFESPNPKIDFARSPFFIQSEGGDWPRGPVPRRAGVSSFGVGGTNAHVVVEEPPASRARDPLGHPDPQLLLLSARSDSALNAMASNLSDHLKAPTDQMLSDVAFTLQAGRARFSHRRFVVADDAHTAARALADQVATDAESHGAGEAEGLVFVFPGQGAQHPGMGADLYSAEPVYAAEIDRVCGAVASIVDGDQLKDFLTKAGTGDASAADALRQTSFAQPAIFAVEVALAALLRHWGLTPDAVLGHSVGEFAAGVVAGVFSVEDAARLVAHRGALMQALPAGTMIAVPLDEAALADYLPDDASLAALNAPGLSVASGPSASMATLTARLAEEGIAAKRLETSHAFHSAMMAPAVAPFAEAVARTPRASPEICFISTRTGGQETTRLTEPDYWAEQIREPVRFAGALKAAHSETNPVFLEVGPGQSAAAMMRRTFGPKGPSVVSCLGPADKPGDARVSLLNALGEMWRTGIEADWSALHGGKAHRVPLPTYPFERRRHWIDPPTKEKTVSQETQPAGPANGQSENEVEALIRRQLTIIEGQLAALTGR
ncbi:MAG: type I polyketide synthase, partial [Pseudomonadota bacterium]